MELLHSFFILPIETVMKIILTFGYRTTDSHGLSIIFLSIVVNIALLPIYNVVQKWRDKDIKKKELMKEMLDKIKKNYKGRERFFYIQAYYKINNYHPISSLKVSMGLLIQILFFISAFSLLSNYESFIGVSFWLLQDLSKADGLFFGLNLLPFIMTILYFFSVHLYSKDSNKNEKYQLWSMGLVFLILLYSQSSSLLLYWTINNLFYFFKVSVKKI